MSWTSALAGAVELRDSGDKGRGLFAARDLARGDVLEVAPCLAVSGENYSSHAKLTVLSEYLFQCKSGNLLMPLGIGGLFNHCERPNVDYRINEPRKIISFTVARQVTKGEELLICYGANLWFDTKSDENDSVISTEDETDGLPLSADIFS